MIDNSTSSHNSNQVIDAELEPLVDVEAVNDADTKVGSLVVKHSTAWLNHHQVLSPGLRWLCLISGLGLLALLAISRSLTPSPLGQGTHEQLGLPPCTSMLLWEKPCPACGMTTSWALATRGEFVAASRANAGGLLLAVIALAFFPASCYFFATGQATRGYWFSTTLTTCLITALVLAIVQWLVRVLG